MPLNETTGGIFIYSSRKEGAYKPVIGLSLLPGGTREGLLNNLNERGFTALALGDEKRDITTLTHLGHHEVHCPHAGIQATGPVSAAIAIPACSATRQQMRNI